MLGVRLFPYSSWVKPILSVHMAVTDRNSHKHWHYLYIILNVSHRFTHHLDITRVGRKPTLILGLFLWRCSIFTNAISTNFNRTKMTNLEINICTPKKKHVIFCGKIPPTSQFVRQNPTGGRHLCRAAVASVAILQGEH